VRRSAALLALGFALLIAAWSMASRPFAAPDEASHYLRALTITNGSLLGPHAVLPVAPATPEQAAWVRPDTRSVEVPAALSPPNELCLDGRPNRQGSCREASYNGDYHPLPYLLPAVALLVSDHADGAVRLSRLASALPCAGLLALAAFLLAGGGGWALLGLLVALTPMVLFVASVLNPNGLEVAGATACTAAVLRVARDRGSPPHWVWAALGLSGAITVLAWQLGPPFVALSLLLGAALLGREGLRALPRRPLLGVAGAILLALVAYLVYGEASGLMHATFDPTPVLHSLRLGVHELWPTLRDSVGHFGLLTVKLPVPAYVLWALATLALLAYAARRAAARSRAVLAVTVAVGLAFPVLLHAWVQRHTGFGMQGRYVLPALMLAPLLAGHLLAASRPPSRAVVTGAFAAAGLFQLWAWWVNARFSAGGSWSLSGWAPLWGWWPWVLVAAAGAGCVGAAGLVPREERR
jgi:hypothetical protein